MQFYGNIDDISGNVTEFIPQIYTNRNLEKYSVLLANIHLNIGDNSYKLPKMITFLEMFGVGKIEHLNVLSRWNKNLGSANWC